MTFSTAISVTDNEGNTYSSVTIGTQIWMAENLRSTKYTDGTEIALVTDNTTWGDINAKAYCWYNNDVAYKSSYGVLYNWYAISAGRICPTGWHAPSDAEWKQLELYLGMNQSDIDKEDWRRSGNVGNKLKEIGSAHWDDNAGATNESGFTALGSGLRNQFGNFSRSRTQAWFWSTTPYDVIGGWGRVIGDSSPTASMIYRGGLLIHYGGSVRCLKD